MTWRGNKHRFRGRSGFKSWLAKIPRPAPELAMMWGFNNEREFYICFLPCMALSFIGLISLQLLFIVYGICWFFGCYALFVLIDSFRNDEDKTSSEFDTMTQKDPPKFDDSKDEFDKFLGSERGDRFKDGLHKATGGTRWAIIGFAILALIALIAIFQENPQLLDGRIEPSGY